MIGDMAQFARSVVDPMASIPNCIADRETSGQGFNVHRNNIAWSLSIALEDTFPVIRKLVGRQTFRDLALAFARQYPPRSPVMLLYGSELPEFLGRFPETADIAYLPDVARLELALRESYHAKDSAKIDAPEIQEYVSRHPTEALLGLSPSTRLVQSTWPVLAIWRFNTENNTPKPKMAEEDVLVTRSNLNVVPHLLPAGGRTFVKAILAGKPLGAAVSAATKEIKAFDLSTTLMLLVATHSITSIGT